MTTASSSNKTVYIKLLISALISGVFLLIPTNEYFTSDMRLFLVITIFALACIGFETVHTLAISVLLPVAYYMSGLLTFEDAFSGWIASVTWICMGAMFLAAVFDRIGLLKRIAYWVILKCGGTFNKTMFGLFLSGAVLSFATFGNAYILSITLGYGVCRAMNLGKSRESALMMMAALCGAMPVRGFIFAPTNLSLMNTGAQTVVPDFNLDWLDQLLYCWPFVIAILIMLFIMTKMYTPDDKLNSSAYFKKQYEALGKMSTAEKKAVVVLVLMLAYLLTTPIHGFAMDYAFYIFPWVLVLPGMDLADAEVYRGFNFTMIYFCAACVSIGTGASVIGFGNLVSHYLTPVLADLPSFVSVLSVFGLGTILNFFMTPLAFLAGFAAPVAQIAVDLGISPIGPLFMLNFAADAIFLPYEYIPYLIAFSFGVFTMKDFIKLNVIKFVVSLICLAVIIIPYWMLLGIL